MNKPWLTLQEGHTYDLKNYRKINFYNQMIS